MNCLFTSRVTVIDDNMNEADAILRGLAKQGIGATYFTGLRTEEFPERPLDGIRLVFLDLHIVSTPGESRKTLLTTIGIFKKLIAATKMLTGIICWTNHPEDFEEFRVLLKERYPDFEALFLLPLSKLDFNINDIDPLAVLRDNIRMSTKIFAYRNIEDTTGSEHRVEGECGGEYSGLCLDDIEDIIVDTRVSINEEIDTLDITKLNVSINDILEECNSFKLACEWEQFVHDAAGNTTSLLAQIAAEDDCTLLSIQAAIACAATDRICEDELYAYQCFIKGCIPILHDYLNNSTGTGINSTDKHIISLLKEMQTLSTHSQEVRAKLNRVLLTTEELAPIGDVRPGNVYIDDGFNLDGEEFPFDYDQKSIRAAIYGLWGSSRENGCMTKPEWGRAVKEIAEGSIPCIMEITPMCDYANKKSFQARLIGGLLLKISDDLPTHMTSSGKISIPAESRIHTKLIEPVYVTDSARGINGCYALILHARCFVSMPFDAFEKCSALLRYRHDVLVDVIAWFAGHAARPGYNSI